MMSSSNNKNIPQVQQKGFFASAKDAMSGASEVTKVITDMRPTLEAAAMNFGAVTRQVDELAMRTQDAIDEVKPELLETTKCLQKTSAVFQELGNQASDVMKKTAKLAVNADIVMQQIRTAFTPIEIVILGKNIVPTLMKISRIIANFAMARDGCRIASFIFNAVSEFGSELGELLKNFLFNPRVCGNVRLTEMLPEGKSQMMSELANFTSIQEWLSENKAFTVTGLAAALAIIFQYALGFPPDLSNVERSVKFFGDRCRGLKSMVDFGRSSWSVFESIADWILSTIFPGVQVHALDDYVQDYGKWAAEVRALHSPDDPFHMRVKKDKSLIYKVERLYRKGLQFSIALGKMQIPFEMKDHYQKHWKLIQDFQKVADYSGVLGNKPRPKPLIVHLFGESGVGKSGATWPLSSDFNASVSDSVEQAQDVAAEVYYRNTEQEFWDGYAGQNVCVYDDFGQRSDTSAKPNEEFMEIIRAGNIAAYPLHMAELSEKSRTKFISKFIILTSNTIEQKVSSLTFPSAVRRRTDVCAKVEIKEEYQKEGYNADTGMAVKRLDPSKCDGSCDTRPYWFVMYDPESKQPLCSEDGTAVRLDYEQFLEHCLAIAAKSFMQSYDFNDAISTRVTPDRFSKLRRMMGKAIKPTPNSLMEGAEEMMGLPNGKSQMDEDPDAQFNMMNEDWSKFIDEAEAEWANARTAPLTNGVVRKFQEAVRSMFSIKGALAVCGTILAGLSVWKFFKVYRSKKTIQSESSGDNKTSQLKTITAEANFVNHRSKAVSKALRHQLQSIDGFHPIDSVLHHLRVLKMTKEELLDIVKNDKKNRFMIQGNQIRANQGHSYEIDPSKLFMPSTEGWATHFTHVKCLPSIREEGVLPMNRAWVHLYPGIHTKLPAHFSGRSAYVHVDLSKCDSEVWETHNGYIHVTSVPTGAITSTGCLEGVSESSSGDNKTGQVKKVIHEAAVSGDNKTNQVKRVIHEASASGDCKTNQAKKIVHEASASGDSRTTRLQKITTEISQEVPAGRMEMWADRSAQELITYRILNNEYRIETDGVPRLNGLFIRDNVMLTCQHLMRVLRNAKEMTIWNMRGSEFTVPVSSLKFQVLTNREGEDKDAMLIQFPRYVNGHSDLVKHFQKMPELASRRADVCLPMIRTINETPLFFIMGNMEAKMETSRFLEMVDGSEVVRHFRDSLRYKANTTEGDCGAPVIVNDNQFIRKIAGIHSSALVDGSGISIGQSVTQADLERGLKNLNETIVQDADELPNIAIPQGVVQMGQQYSVEELIQTFSLPGPTFGHVGTCSKIVKPPGKTDLRRSKMYGFVESITKPAYLWHKDVNILHKNVGKNALNTPFITDEEVNRAVAEVKPLLLSGESRKRLARIYNFEEAVSGSSDSEYITGIARQTSPGYPWVLDRVSGAPGKTTWFGTDEWVFDDDVRNAVEERIERARRGERTPTVWCDTLKDERRPIEKVEQLKTRVFSHGPMDYTIAVRQYYIGFVAHIMENRIDNEQSIGTNPFGADWERTARKLKTFGDRVFAGDFSQFDGTLNSCILEKFADVANAFYNDGEENARIRRVLLADVYNSVHLCDGEYIQLTHSQPSGNPLTTILNSFYNSVSMRIAYYRCGKLPSFKEHVSMVSYGDDNVINISPTVSGIFNQRSVTAAYATFGMIYTDEAKSSGEVAPWRKLEEVAYLKRGFRKEHGRWMAPLAMETILETCNWVRKGDPVEALKQNVEGSFRELAQHPVEVFEQTTQMICDAFFNATNIYPELQTRDAYLEDESPHF